MTRQIVIQITIIFKNKQITCISSILRMLIIPIYLAAYSLQWRHNDHDGSQITSLTVVYSTVYSDADQRKHQSSASLVFVWGIHRGRWIPHTKGQLHGKCFHLMTSSCLASYFCQHSIYIHDPYKGQWSIAFKIWLSDGCYVPLCLRK